MNDKVKRDTLNGKFLKGNLSAKEYIFNINQLDIFEMNYWAGFLAADGSIEYRMPTRSNRLTLSISQLDIEHLIKFKEFLEYTGPIKLFQTETSDMASLRISSNELTNRLKEKFNIVPNKSLILQPPSLENDDALAYIKGYIDGDGCIRMYKSGALKKEYLKLSLVSGSYDILAWIQSFINKNVKTKAKIRKANPPHNYFTYELTCKAAREFLLLLKSIKTPYLSRKWDKVI